ncbi:MAG: beta-hydroxyacyl-ACP dehydratase [Pirellulales bacterium]|nr:beta-hydroxyacyl-ACP dehydratase [Pirellulales bacterium]
MRFSLIDRILELEPNKHIRAVKTVALSEEYLADHFPKFPVLPGVMMIEAMTQTAAWLIRKSEDFANSVVMLKEARNVRYASFVEPGHTLTVTAEIVKQDERLTTFKANGKVGERSCVGARLVLERFNAADNGLGVVETDAYTRREMRELFDLLYHPEDKEVLAG